MFLNKKEIEQERGWAGRPEMRWGLFSEEALSVNSDSHHYHMAWGHFSRVAVTESFSWAKIPLWRSVLLVTWLMPRGSGVDHRAAIECHTPDEICVFVQRDLFVTLMFLTWGGKNNGSGWISQACAFNRNYIQAVQKRAWQYYDEKRRQRVQWCVITMSFQVKATVLYVQ